MKELFLNQILGIPARQPAPSPGAGPLHAFLTISFSKRVSLLQALLAFVWVFNIAAVIVWMPWLYCWQYQPTKE